MPTTPDRANGDRAIGGAASYDLTEKMVPFLDRHLVFPLLEFLGNKNEDMLKAKYDLLSATNMVDYCTELYKELHHVEEVPEGTQRLTAPFERKRNQVLAEMAQLEQDAQKIIAVIENPEVIAALKQDKQHNRQFLEKEYGVRFPFTSEMAQDLFKYGRFQYSCGNYGGAGEILYHYRVLVSPRDRGAISADVELSGAGFPSLTRTTAGPQFVDVVKSTDAELDFAALWGKLACEILTGNWEVALEEVQNLKEHIESK
ncbi:MAG: eIF3 subunit 6 N terminal domain-containing protein, partial [Olpidium bornovanus]